MDYLTQTMIDLDFDSKQFLRAIYNSSTYQTLATGTDVINVNEYSFNGPVVRRMTAEQIWDSLLTMAVENVDERQSASQPQMRYLMLGDSDIYDSYERLRQMRPEELLELAKSIKSGNRRAKASMATNR